MSIRTVRTNGIGRFQIVHDPKIASHSWDLEYILFLTRVQGFHGLSIRTVRTDGTGRFQSVHDWKIASINGTYNISPFLSE